MFTTITSQKRIVTALVGSILLFGIVFSIAPMQAQAQTDNTVALRAQIDALMVLVLQLTQQLAVQSNPSSETSIEGGFTDRSISVGGRVQTTDTLKVRSGAGTGYNWVNNISAYTGGKVVNGPRYGNGYTWWLINYDNGTQGWSAENWLKKISGTVTVLPENDKILVDESGSDRIEYDLDITSPRSGRIYERGDKVVLRWSQENLDDDVAIITFQGPIDGGQQTQRHIATNVKLSSGKKTVTIPTYDDLGIVTSGTYELSIWVTNIKDGSEKSKSDVIKIIVGKDSLPSCRLSLDKLSYKYQDQIKISWASKNTNYVSFVPDRSGKDSLIVPAGKNGDLNGYTYIDAWVTGNPKVTMEAHAADGSKSYCDIVIPIDSDDTQDLVMGSMAIGVGAYEGSYSKGVQHSFGYHPQGEIEVYLSDNTNTSGSLTLVLSSYEPVKWNITGPGKSAIGEVLATGYYDQEVSGLDVPVTMLSSESGDRNYFTVYKNSGRPFEKLKKFIMKEYQTKFQMYDGSYKQKKVVFDKWKG